MSGPRADGARHDTAVSREAILAAAERLMITEGYEKASIARTCRESGYPVGSLYYHFGSKAALLAAVYQRFEQRFFADLTGAVERAGTAEEGLAAFWDGAVRAVLDDYPYFALNLELLRISHEDPDIAAVMEADTRAFERHIGAAFGRFASAAGVPDAEERAQRMARIAVTYSRAAIMIAGEDQDRYLRQMADFYPFLRQIIAGTG
ncbi:transcriptional regulatory protein (probably TETR/ACRR-family) [Streptomyces zinciresistens K42]|uniref:Transcriptional regulatory protein (Probably TETR/ACRR-family) n=1 Tax=Streptomyces zinciresistens K42 TaxID=700597 RepID=G2GM65_9ACTN|nr:TetR/AcrR family transcriptional regulator [Streptomyces zinciresistens]EGX55388.1 transcriptional regulatory protein (probably TETR/ACRR-family) [Streptomyces zinciresistens K42]